MLTPGHFAGAYLTAKVITIPYPELNNSFFLSLATFFGTFPDFDFFYIFFKTKKFLASSKFEHRNFVTHTPFYYFLLVILGFVFFPSFYQIILAFAIGTFGHFFLDTFATVGIPWFSPFSKKLCSFIKTDPRFETSQQHFLKHWWIIASTYYTKTKIAKFEIILCILAIIVLIKDLLK